MHFMIGNLLIKALNFRVLSLVTQVKTLYTHKPNKNERNIENGGGSIENLLITCSPMCYLKDKD